MKALHRTALPSVVGAFVVTLVLGLVVIRSSSVMSQQIERAIRESEKRFAVLVEALKEYALFMVDPDGFILTWNAGAERIIHEHLYESRDLAHIDFSNYLQSLVSGLIRSYAADPALVNVHIDSEKIAVDLDTAIPCGIITTELVSNALKYAFPDRRKGDLQIGFHERGPNAYELTVQDNGIGLPQGIRLDQTNSLGLRLVNTLVRQLNGKVHFESNGGTRFDIAFKLSSRGGNR